MVSIFSLQIETKSTKKEFIRWESLERSPKEEKHEVKAG